MSGVIFSEDSSCSKSETVLCSCICRALSMCQALRGKCWRGPTCFPEEAGVQLLRADIQVGRGAAWPSPQTTSWTHLLQFREERGDAGCPQSAASPCCEAQWARGSEAPRRTGCAPQEQETWWERGFAATCVQAWEQGSVFCLGSSKSHFYVTPLPFDLSFLE